MTSVTEFPTDERRGQLLHEEMLAEARAIVAGLDWATPEKVPLRTVS